MRVWNTFLVDLKKALFQPGFPLGALLFCALCFTSIGYAESGGSVSVLELAIYYSREQVSQKFLLSARGLFAGGMDTYTIMFAPMIAALPAVPLFCRERANGAARFILPRCGITARCAGFQLAAMVSGGLTVLLGYGLYGVCCAVLFPPTTQEMAAITAMTPVSALLDIVFRLAGGFLFGMTSVLLPAALSGLTQNAYVVLCASFSVLYALHTFWGQAAGAALLAGQMARYSLATILDPASVVWLFQYGPQVICGILLLWLCLALLTFWLLPACIRRRFDRGG